MQKFYEGLGAEEGGVAQKARVLQTKLNQRLQVLLDKTTPKPVERWISLTVLVFLYFVRVRRKSPEPRAFGPKDFGASCADRTRKRRSFRSPRLIQIGFRSSRFLHCDLWFGHLQPEPADRLHLASDRS
mmetsp:Transcript_3428/g.9585  ORF Transcript_3428/g.9585 Transcript_3428/m.9585 type:complete len:129 (-) Transcript_3428:453-839(-)